MTFKGPTRSSEPRNFRTVTFIGTTCGAVCDYTSLSLWNSATDYFQIGNLALRTSSILDFRSIHVPYISANKRTRSDFSFSCSHILCRTTTIVGRCQSLARTARCSTLLPRLQLRTSLTRGSLPFPHLVIPLSGTQQVLDGLLGASSPVLQAHCAKPGQMAATLHHLDSRGHVDLHVL